MIDTHVHFWRYERDQFDWIPESMASTRRDFLPGELEPQLPRTGVSGVIAVQAGSTIHETDWLLGLAAQSRMIVGVVGWLPIAAEDFGDIVARYARTRLCGLRHIVPAEPVGFLERPDFNRGISQLAAAGLTYDLLINSVRLSETVPFAARHPDVTMVLDHLGKPENNLRRLEPWATHLRALAENPNVYCKLSGGICEAEPTWTPDSLRPYFDTALEAFGPDRLIVGSNWPLIHAAGGYMVWTDAVAEWCNRRLGADGAARLGANTERAYRLLPTDTTGRPHE